MYVNSLSVVYVWEALLAEQCLKYEALFLPYTVAGHLEHARIVVSIIKTLNFNIKPGEFFVKQFFVIVKPEIAPAML